MEKRMWLRIFVVVFLIVSFWVAIGFRWVSLKYEFPNPLEEIVSIELLINTNEVGKAEVDKLIFQKRLSSDEIESFMKEVYELETRRCHPPMWGWGKYIAKVTYSNGDVELLGTGNIEYVEKGSHASGSGWYSFWGYGIYEEVLLRYLD